MFPGEILIFQFGTSSWVGEMTKTVNGKGFQESGREKRTRIFLANQKMAVKLRNE